ncbi:MAG: UDP-N-acetylglucosamine 1-carboxyvinyltransferase [Phascolarctobacterium sp.]|nr:UDP-N-acetylglucosamine 1-carboxyvinyltransferase [Phascolarctobacterium sp.]MBQ8690581.1 UDP-N-acetylglucosamine 1-carboxyvinyltransferase [Phascolarctobacterium sp.]MBR2070962.1 UDP-N-acetylglucosamine 1-carboxyvinyltransferase [Phascolarctobacterium sp.]MBR2139687.1 UDP-N-acetylglucosamine 1-carboxyvinyltransferase [Phascolarctobacterium sp.]
MEKLIVKGGKRLVGTVKTSGAKNAVLPIIAASIMGVTPSHFDEVPMLEDVRTISEVLKSLGIKVESKEKNVLDIDSTTINSYEPPCELMRNMRASFFIMGPLLARMGKARIHMPGGCAIGARPVDIHLKGFEALGVVLKQEDGFIEATTPNGLKGATIYFDFPSVGATENVMMAAALAEGVTILENAAEEPEIVALANYLNKMGAKVRGAGTDVIRIEGVKELRGADYTIIPDRIEAGTYMIAAAMTGGDVIIDNVLPEHQKPLIAKLREAGAIVEEDIDKVRVIGTGSLKGVSVKTLPYPGFPTDMQAQIMAMMVVSEGNSRVTETVFENRFMHVAELNRMGAKITTADRSANIEGPAKLVGCDVRATDLRAGAAMILAGLVAEGETRIGDLFHIDRGYEDIVEKLRNLGADIERVDV